MFVQPIAGQVVPDPERGGFLPKNGAEVPENQYWLRRESAGEIKRVMPIAEAELAAEADSVAGLIALDAVAVESITQKKGAKA